LNKNQLTFCLSFYGRFLDFLSVEKKSSSRAVEQEQEQEQQPKKKKKKTKKASESFREKTEVMLINK